MSSRAPIGLSAGTCGLKTRLFCSTLGLLCIGIAVAPARADAVSITYAATKLGGSQWEYQYKVSGTLSANDDIAIYFPVGTSSGLTDLMTGGPNFMTFVLPPDPLLPADGEFDILPILTNPGLSPTFTVSFLYSGLGTPGSQAFTLYDPNFTVLGTGTTQSAATPVVPEPETLLLVGTGIASLVRLRRRSA